MSIAFKQSLFIIPLILLYSCGTKNDSGLPAEKILKVSVKEILTGNLNEQLDYSGTIQPDNTVQLGFSIPGRVADVAVQEGQHVSKGQLLAVIETTEYQNALTIANAGFEQAQDNFIRSNELHLKGSLTDKDFIAAKLSLKQAEANKNLAEKHLADNYLKAPFDGIVTAKLAERGASVFPGAPAFTLMKTDFVYAQASVSETDINKLLVGTKATVIVAAARDTLHGTVSIINPQGDIQSKTYSVKVRIANNDRHLLPGMISEIKVNTGNIFRTITVPGESVIRDADDLPYVFIINQDQRVVRKRITVGGLSDSAVIVTSGLKGGESIVTTGQKYIQEGQKVSVN